jgi:hyperosmotically inducible periplasmic protein
MRNLERTIEPEFPLPISAPRLQWEGSSFETEKLDPDRLSPFGFGMPVAGCFFPSVWLLNTDKDYHPRVSSGAKLLELRQNLARHFWHVICYFKSAGWRGFGANRSTRSLRHQYSKQKGGSRNMKITSFKPLVFSLVLILPIFAAGGNNSMAAQSVGEYIDDATVTTAVKAKLVAEKASNFTRISVETNNNIVTLTGEVESKDEKERAEQIAKQVNGVKRVDNKLEIKERG